MMPPVMEHWEQRLPVLESGKSIEISPVPLAVQEEFLYSMEDRSEGLLQVKVYEGEETIYEWRIPLELAWAGGMERSSYDAGSWRRFMCCHTIRALSAWQQELPGFYISGRTARPLPVIGPEIRKR